MTWQWLDTIGYLGRGVLYLITTDLGLKSLNLTFQIKPCTMEKKFYSCTSCPSLLTWESNALSYLGSSKAGLMICRSTIWSTVIGMHYSRPNMYFHCSITLIFHCCAGNWTVSQQFDMCVLENCCILGPIMEFEVYRNTPLFFCAHD